MHVRMHVHMCVHTCVCMSVSYLENEYNRYKKLFLLVREAQIARAIVEVVKNDGLRYKRVQQTVIMSTYQEDKAINNNVHTIQEIYYYSYYNTT